MIFTWRKILTALPRQSRTLEPEKRKICIVADSTVASLYLNPVKAVLEKSFAGVSIFTFPSGEPSKNLDTVRELYRHLIEAHFDRKDVLAALGGGVTGDLTGYAAATYLRALISPDPHHSAGPGSQQHRRKNRVDFDGYKNMVGAFHIPPWFMPTFPHSRLLRQSSSPAVWARC